MEIALIGAMSLNRVIGKGGTIPWNLPSDLQRFKRLTLGHPIIMGRKTYESIIERNGRMLPERAPVVLSRKADFEAPGCYVAKTIAEAIEKASTINTRKVFVIGGGEIYKAALPVADKVFLTTVSIECDGDSFFPELGDEWLIEISETIGTDHLNRFTQNFSIFRRNNSRATP